MAELFGYYRKKGPALAPGEGEALLGALSTAVGGTRLRDIHHLTSDRAGIASLDPPALLSRRGDDRALHSVLVAVGSPTLPGKTRDELRRVEQKGALGADDIGRLEGKLALVSYEREPERLLLFRDTFGQQPLFVLEDTRLLLFATRVRAFLGSVRQHLSDPRMEVNRESLAEWAALQMNLGERTLLRRVSRLRPGVSLVLTPDGWTRKDVAATPPPQIAQAPLSPGELLSLVDGSVRSCLEDSSAPGVLVSGGLDSSTMALLASRHATTGLRTFTGHYAEGPEYDETRHARAVAEAAGSRHREILITASDWADHLVPTFRALDLPMAGPGSVGQLVVARNLDEDLDLVLTGEGGDELFGGYARIVAAHAVAGGASPADLPRILSPLGDYSSLLEGMGSTSLDPVSVWIRLVLRSSGTSRGWSQDLLGEIERVDVESRLRAEIGRSRETDPTKKILEVERRSLLPVLLELDHLILGEVWRSGACPFLSSEIVRRVSALDADTLLSGEGPKPFLRRAVKDLLPGAILARTDKMGFPVPLQVWARGELRETFSEILLSREARERGLLDPAGVEQLLSSEKPYGRELWGLLSLEIFCRVLGERVGAR